MERNSRKVYRGIVVSDKSEKTISVAVTNYRMHRLYGKRTKVTKKFHAHDENNDARVGDYVAIQETRPLSKTKSFRLLRIITRAQVAEEITSEAVEIGGLDA